MVRRRIPKSRADKGKARPVKRADAKLKRWDKASDIPLDEEDQFHSSRDKILLEGDGDDDDDDLEGDEVFSLKGMPDEDDEDDDEPDFEHNEDEDIDMEESTEPGPSTKSKSKSKKKLAKQDSSSDEDDEEDEEETWGRGKSAYYNSNAAELSSDDEEANEMEEQEARRLQVKARDTMHDEDFGLLDPRDVVDPQDLPLNDAAESSMTVLSKLPKDKKSLLRHLEKTNPIALALARDWEDTARNLIRIKEKIKEVEAEEPDALSLGMIHLHYQTLLTYTSTLAFYLHLRASEKYAQRPELLESHPILQRLLTLKQALSTLEELDFAMSDSDEDDLDDEEEDFEMSDAQGLWNIDRLGLESSELDDLLKDAMDIEPSASKPKGKSKAKKSSSEVETPEPPKKKRKTAKAAELPVFDLVEPEFPATKRATSRRTEDEEDAHGELSALDHADAADKSSRKRSLRFHTSRIESASARRHGARNAALGGDDDIPYRERRKEKEARLAKENAKKEKGQGGADLDDPEPQKLDKISHSDADVDEADEAGPDGYYELVKRKTKEKKERKKAEYEETRAAERAMIEEEADVAGPRSATRAILANRGLTPHRPKTVRNPRVKKRLKFEKAKKKVASQKAVYKGGLSATGRYEGETSGISKVVKSIRLS